MTSKLDITLLEETTSTNELALEAIDGGAPAGTAFVAERQTAGRGRRESRGGRRPWFSPAGKNLYLSVVVCPDVEVSKAAGITLAVGVQLVELLRDTHRIDVELKWPNDLYVGDLKLGGILTEAVTGAGGLKGAAVGVGLNVNVEADEFPEQLHRTATSLLMETGQRSDRLSTGLEMIRRIVEATELFERQGLEAFSGRLDRYNYLEGHRVRVGEGSVCRGGIARTIGSSGGLVVEFDDGERREIVSGEVTVERLERR